MTLDAFKSKVSVSGLWAIVLGASLLLCGCSAVYRPYQVAGSSMLPLFHPGDRIFVDESDGSRSDLHDGDVIALRRKDAIVLKRIMAMPGETISGEDRKIFRNGKQLDEPYLAPVRSDDPPGLVTFAPHTVGAAELFVMGDNRDLSLDSRYDEYEPVRLVDVVGEYRLTYWHAPVEAKAK